MNVSLVMVSADGKLKELPAMSLPFAIGRGDDCKVRVPLAAVSRKHCELLNDDDELIVKDLKSSNGTFVNKERIKQRELIPGDLLAVGPILFVVRIDGHPKVIDPIIAWANGAVGIGEGGGEMIDGVPSWGPGGGGGAASNKPTVMSPGVGARSSGANPGAQPPPKKPAMPDGDESLDDIIKDLSESDFDIDFDDPPGKKK